MTPLSITGWRRWLSSAAPWVDLLLFSSLVLGALDTPQISLRIACDALVASWALLRCLLLGLNSQEQSSRILFFGLFLLLALGLRSFVLDSIPKELITRPTSIFDWILVLAAFSIGARNNLRQWWLFWSFWIAACLAVVLGSLAFSHGANLSFNPDLRLGLYWTTLACYLFAFSAIAAAGFLLLARTPLLRLLAAASLIAAMAGLLASDSRISTFAVLAGLGSGGALLLSLEHPRNRWVCWLRQRQQPLRRWAIGAIAALSATALTLWSWVVFSDQQAFVASIRVLDGADQGRAILSRCYFGIPLSGNNRFLLGGGFQRSRELLCSSEATGINRILGLPAEKSFNHAHSIWGQIAGDSGMVALAAAICVAITLIALWVKAYRQLKISFSAMPASQQQQTKLHVLNGLAAGVFLLLTSFVHSALFHLPGILAVFGYILAAPLAWSQTPKTA